MAVVLAVIAAWLVISSPGAIDGPSGYSEAPTPGAVIEVEVEPGEAPSEIAETLEARGAIESGTQFRVLVSLMGYDGLLQAGNYELQRNMPALDVIYRMRNGIVSTRSVTVVEGWQMGEIADAVDQQGVSRGDFLAAAGSREYDFDLVQAIPEGESLQGYLYPATYSLRASDTGATVVEHMLEAFDANVPDDVMTKAEALGLTLHEVVTLASIIEREAQAADESSIMAQVFLKRLRDGYSLDADPTVQFALAQDPGNVAEFGYWKQALTLDDLAYDSPYNTYVYYGLPPGPICNPSAASITAVVNPTDTEFLYFVAKSDGTHAFAETYEEHLANVELHQGGSQ
ncbi:MAG: endolytic transglycosylase MltG [Dehalococcoidia bacterium]